MPPARTMLGSKLHLCGGLEFGLPLLGLSELLPRGRCLFKALLKCLNQLRRQHNPSMEIPVVCLRSIVVLAEKKIPNSKTSSLRETRKPIMLAYLTSICTSPLESMHSARFRLLLPEICTLLQLGLWYSNLVVICNGLF